MISRTNSNVVVVTGASAGVGRATAAAFALRGAHVALLARGRAGLAAAQKEIEANGGVALAIPTDVSDPDAVEEAARITEGELGPITTWVNNAMISVFSPAIDVDPKDFKRVTEVTYLGVVYGTQTALRRMLPRNQGRIIQVGSALAYRGIPLQAAYCAAKHAIQGFTESLRCELLHDGSDVRISMVQMPALNTPQFSWVKNQLPRTAQPVPPIYQPEVAAAAIVHAADHYRREWFVGGPTVVAIQGNKIIPGIADKYLARTGYDSQQSDEPKSEPHQDNLYHPLDDDRDYGAHGSFDEQAHSVSVQLCLDQFRDLLLTGTAVGALSGFTVRGKSGILGGALLGLAAATLTGFGIGAAKQLRLERAHRLAST